MCEKSYFSYVIYIHISELLKGTYFKNFRNFKVINIYKNST